MAQGLACLPPRSAYARLIQDVLDWSARHPEDWRTTWQLVEDKKITKEFKFKDFVEAKYFLDMVSVIAEEQGHHPNMTIVYNKVKITCTTHAAGGLTENDFIIAKIIDELV